jgi:hypothetical protein
MAKLKLIGHVGVDSGQLMIADPCYVESEWEKGREFTDKRLYRHRDGRYFAYGAKLTGKDLPKGAKVRYFKRYDEKLDGDLGMNDMIGAKSVEEVPIPSRVARRGRMSYAGVCETTLAGRHQLGFDLGPGCAGVAFRSGYGDGTYPVYAEKGRDGTVKRVIIEMA